MMIYFMAYSNNERSLTSIQVSGGLLFLLLELGSR